MRTLLLVLGLLGLLALALAVDASPAAAGDDKESSAAFRMGGYGKPRRHDGYKAPKLCKLKSEKEKEKEKEKSHGRRGSGRGGRGGGGGEGYRGRPDYEQSEPDYAVGKCHDGDCVAVDHACYSDEKAAVLASELSVSQQDAEAALQAACDLEKQALQDAVETAHYGNDDDVCDARNKSLFSSDRDSTWLIILLVAVAAAAGAILLLLVLCNRPRRQEFA